MVKCDVEGCDEIARALVFVPDENMCKHCLEDYVSRNWV